MSQRSAFSIRFRAPTFLNSTERQCGQCVENIANYRCGCGARQPMAPWRLGAGRRGAFLFSSAAWRASAHVFACIRISSSVKVIVHGWSLSPRRSRSARHRSGSSCIWMPYLRVSARSALTVYSVRVRSVAVDSNANTRNHVSCVKPVSMNCMLLLLPSSPNCLAVPPFASQGFASRWTY
jgi:hypothetical protein